MMVWDREGGALVIAHRHDRNVQGQDFIHSTGEWVSGGTPTILCLRTYTKPRQELYCSPAHNPHTIPANGHPTLRTGTR